MPATTEQSLAELAEQLEQARSPIEIFGPLGGTRAEQLAAGRRAFRALALICHPDKALDADGEEAERAFARLNALWERAQQQIRAGVYGTTAGDAFGLKVNGRHGRYTLAHLIARGDVADVYRCAIGDPNHWNSGRGIFKLARRPSSASFIQNEARALRRFATEVDDEYKPYFPELIESLRCRGKGGIHRLANVMTEVDGLYSVAELVKLYQRARWQIDPKDMAWIWRRVLTGVGAAHKAGIIHGALLPTHILIHPEQHGVVLVGWGTAGERGKIQRTISSAYRHWYPSEVFDHKGVAEETDIAMAARTMIYLLGGDPILCRCPNTTPRPLRAFFKGCTLAKMNMRPDDAWALKDTFTDLIERLWGPRRFHPFKMPSGSGT